MSRPFLICALPRSRTAWLANFLTAGRIQCHHELSSATSLHGIKEMLYHGAADFCGNADTAQMLHAVELKHLMPLAPVVVVKRDPAEVERSLAALGLPIIPHAVGLLQTSLLHAEKLPNVLSVKYEDLAAESTLRAIQAHVAPGEPFDRQRFQMLSGMKIEITKERLNQILRGMMEKEGD